MARISSARRLTLLYDGACPFCRHRIETLLRRDHKGRLAVEDISAHDFDPAKYGLSQDDVLREIHAVKPDGTVVKGMDAVREACRVVRLGWLVAPSRLPLIRKLFDWLYKWIARHRHRSGRSTPHSIDK